MGDIRWDERINKMKGTNESKKETVVSGEYDFSVLAVMVDGETRGRANERGRRGWRWRVGKG